MTSSATATANWKKTDASKLEEKDKIPPQSDPVEELESPSPFRIKRPVT